MTEFERVALTQYENEKQRAEAAESDRNALAKKLDRLMTVIGNPGACRSCGARILWIFSKDRKLMPYDPDGVTHFATCPDAKEWSKR
jgi:hypothetical protein